MANTIEREKLRDLVAGRLRDMILAESLQPGDRLPTEAQLAERFGVSRLSLREATKMLEFLGVIRSKPGLGLSVGSIGIDRITEYLGFHQSFQSMSSDTLIETRVAIEVGVLPYVAAKMKKDRMIERTLTELNVAMRKNAHEHSAWVELDVEFHRTLVVESGLEPLLPFGDLVRALFEKYRRSKLATIDIHAAMLQGMEQHEEVVDALAVGNVDRARRVMTGHIRTWRDYLSVPN